MSCSLVVYVNNDDALLIWSVEAIVAQWQGFAVQRKHKHGTGWTEAIWLENWTTAGPQAHQSGTHQSSRQWPFRCLTWTDHSVSQGDCVSYRVIPILSDGSIDESNASQWSGEQTLGAPSTTPYSAYFNRGFVISQFISRYLDQRFPGMSRSDALAAFKSGLSDSSEEAIRHFLGGLIRPTMLELLASAKADGGHIYAALFELADPELQAGLTALGPRAHLVLANGSSEKRKSETTADARKRDENRTARAALAASHCDVEALNRFVAPQPLAHNKFMVVTDAQQTPMLVWTGSTNWTPTGLCTQLNNGLLCQDPDVAKAYLTQWRALRAAASGHPDSLTSDNSKPASFVSASGVRTTVQFTRANKRVDLAALGDVVAAAKLGVLFLMFMPGAAGALADVRAAAKRPELLVRGVVSTLPNGPADEHTGNTTTLTTTLLGGPPSLPKTQTVDVVQPQGMEHVAAGWAIETTRQQFLSRIGYAIIHSKVLVVDPFSDDPVVVTGSHNFSISASEDNDENYIIIRGDHKLAEAYAVNIESAWRHYAARMGNPHTSLRRSAYLEALLEDQQREKCFWGVSPPSNDLGTSNEMRR